MVAVAQVVVANCGGGKLWSRAGVRVVERGSRKKASGELAAVFYKQRASRTAVVFRTVARWWKERHDEVVR